MVWAEIKSGETPHQIISHTVRLPDSIPLGNVAAYQRSQAHKTLSDIGFAKEEIEDAKLHISALPTEQEVRAELRGKRCSGAELILADLTLWEACRARLNLTPEAVDDEQEMNFDELKIRRSAVA
jgi:hypothetical protein